MSDGASNSQSRRRSKRAKAKTGVIARKSRNGGNRNFPQATRQLDECSRKYLKARLDPFDADAAGACVPDGQSGNSFKYRTVLQGAEVSLHLEPNPSGLSLGVALIITPSAANDQATISAYACLATHSLDELGQNATPLLAQYNMYGSPFDGAAFGAGNLEQRCVGFGVNILNRGMPLYQQGTAFGYAEGAYGLRTGDYMSGTSTLGSRAGYPLTRRVGMSKMEDVPLTLLYAPESEIATKQWYVEPHMLGITGHYTHMAKHTSMIIWVPCDGQGSVNLTIDCSAHWEVKGRTVRSFSSPNPASPMVDAVRSAAINTTKAIFGQLPSGYEMVKYAAQLALTSYTGGDSLALSPPMVRPYSHRMLEL